MPSSPHNPRLGAAVLRTYLQNALPDSRLSDGVVDSTYEPLLLLQATHTLAGFALSNGDMRKSYEALYGSFKKYCAEQQEHLDALDLAFVFCVQSGVPDLDSFCSNVETNVYFCRKFVVELAQPLGSALARLPFLPLTPLYGKTLRPPSAQTFLQQSGVPAVLAHYLVVPGRAKPRTHRRRLHEQYVWRTQTFQADPSRVITSRRRYCRFGPARNVINRELSRVPKATDI